MKIRIVKTPEGEAPKQVREQWIGLELPYIGTESIGGGVLSGELKIYDRPGYIVPIRAAIEALAAINSEAATWWSVLLGHKNGCLIFDAEACVIIE